MINIIKDILFYVSLIFGSFCLVSLILCGAYNCFLLLINRTKHATFLIELAKYYKKHKKDIDLKIKKEDMRNL